MVVGFPVGIAPEAKMSFAKLWVDDAGRIFWMIEKIGVAIAFPKRLFGLPTAYPAVDLSPKSDGHTVAEELIHLNISSIERKGVLHRICEQGAHFAEMTSDLHIQKVMISWRGTR